MKNSLLSLLMGAGALALFSGCHTGGAYTPVNTTKYDVENQSPFVLLDAGVQRSVTTSGVQETKLPDGRLQVSVNVRNREERRIQVQINCEFKDAQGFVVDATPFQTLILPERAQEGVRFVSMNDKAVRYTIRVRQAH
ncbi:MAG: YcfL family protein [Verrucomicrobiales bacterium]